MSRRIVIGGGTILSTDPTETTIAGSAPVNATVRIYQHDDDKDYYHYLFDGNGSTELRCRIQIIGNTDADAQTAFDNLEAVLKAIKSKTVEFQYVSGGRRWNAPADFSENFDLIADVVASKRAFRIDCRWLSQGTSGDPGTPTGGVTPVIYTVHFAPGGLATVKGTCTFSSRTAMNDWIDDLEAGTTPPFPAEFGSDMTFYRWEPEYAYKPSGFSGSQLHAVTVEFRQQMGDLANDPAFAMLRDWGFTSVKHDRQANSFRGGKPPKDITVSGNLQFKTEELTAYRPGDSVVTTREDVIDSVADAAIDRIIQDLSDRLPFDTHELERKGDFDEKDGFYNFTVSMIMPEGNDPQIMYIEKMRFRYESNTIRAERADGSTKTWSSPTGMNIFLEHEITIRSFKKPRYRAPLVTVPSQWDSQGGETNHPEAERMLHSSGEVVWLLEQKTFWQRNSDGESDVVPPPAGTNEVLDSIDLQ